MLAQNFKTPTELGITDAEFDALVDVLGMMERGELVDTSEHEPAATDYGFAIGCQYKKHSCGTMACIGGWAAILMGRDDPEDYVNQYMNGGTLQPLYWGFPGSANSAQAALALRNFLTHGEPRWGETLNESG